MIDVPGDKPSTVKYNSHSHGTTLLSQMQPRFFFVSVCTPTRVSLSLLVTETETSFVQYQPGERKSVLFYTPPDICVQFLFVFQWIFNFGDFCELVPTFCYTLLPLPSKPVLLL